MAAPETVQADEGLHRTRQLQGKAEGCEHGHRGCRAHSVGHGLPLNKRLSTVERAGVVLPGELRSSLETGTSPLV